MQTEPSTKAIQQLMTSTPPGFSVVDAISIASRYYGIEAGAHLLVSERDQNFRLDAQDGKRYTLKISNHAERLEVVDFQSRALIHIEKRDSSLPVPRVIRNLDGALHCAVDNGGKTHFVRVLSWLEGLVIHDAEVSADMSRRMGRLLARLDLAFEGFDHPGSNPPLLWDMKRATDLHGLLDYIEDAYLRQLIAQTLKRFITTVKPALDTLRAQVIHNDMNPGNVLVDKDQPENICGIIDFGDMVKSPMVIDLAVAAAYQLGHGDDPLGGALPLIAGYHAVQPLEELEMELLTDLIRTRLITSLLICSYRVSLFPENREYLTISHDSARKFLIGLSGLNADDAFERIRTACFST